jgi:HAE1 family hydrophobic/amphiphilic exporter-1
MNFTQLIIKRPTIVVVFFSILTLLGITSYSKLNYDLFPKMDIPVISISTQYSGASASEVENSVTKILEDALSSMGKVKELSSTSQEGMSSITIQLESDANVDNALQDAQRKVNAALSQLPQDASSPMINKFSSDEMPVMKLGVTADMEQTKLYQIVKNQIKARISRISGVGQVSIVGGDEREILINVKKEMLDAYKLSISRIYDAVLNANQEFPTGKIEDNSKQYSVRLSGKISSIDILRNTIVLTTTSGSIVRLSDVADIVDGTAENRNINRINGVNSLGILIQKQSDANTVNVSKLVQKEIKRIEQTYSASNMKFDIASDNSVYTLESAKKVFEDLMYAILLVSIVMFFFLHSIRNSFIVMVSIPSSIISVFIAMYVFNFTLNMMTLLALALVIGILVDDSIVVLENIHRHLKMGKDRKQAAIDGRSEIGFTAVAITMVDIVVFLPLSLVGGMIGHMLKEFALVVVFSTLMSLVVSFTITPLLASRFSKIEKLTKGTIMGILALGFENVFNYIKNLYEQILCWSLAHRKSVYALTGLLIILTFSLLPLGLIGSEFIASGDKGEFVIKLEGAPQNTLAQTNALTQQVERLIIGRPEVVKVFSNIGYSSSMQSGSNEQNKSELTVTLVPKEKRKQSVDEYAAMIKNEITTIPGIKVTSSATTITGGSMESAIQIMLSGSDIDRLYTVADSLMKIIKEIPGAGDVKLSVDKNNPEIQVQLNRDKMSHLGLSVSDVGSTLRLALSGNSSMQYSDNGVDYDITIKFDKINRKKIDDVKNITFINNKGDLVELQDFASVTQSMAPNKLERSNRNSSLTVNASVNGRFVGTVGEEIRKALNSKITSNDVSIEFKGQMQHQSEAFGSLFIAIFAALVLVYLVMVLLYNSYSRPFIVFFSIPVAIIGALLALALTRSSLSIFSIIGLIMLIGLVCKNAILLVDFTNQLREKGLSIRDALVEAGKVRLRPILMTTLSMIFGMLPIALASAAGAEVKNGMAWVIIGGLSSSLVLTLILVPSVYLSLDSLKMRFTKQNILKERK